MGSLVDVMPYWHVNVPADQRTKECPVYLRSLSDKDRGIIATPESEYRRDTWEEAKKKVEDKRFDLFKRTPSDLWRYREFAWRLRQAPDGILNFILARRLYWPQPIVPIGKPFEFDEDIKILWNDWPYAVDQRIVHLVVWVKFELEEDPATGLVTEATNAAISTYVRKTFSAIPPEHVIWFKNWGAIKSVKAIEHFHVMLFDPDMEFVQAITNGDVPTYKRENWSPF